MKTFHDASMEWMTIHEMEISGSTAFGYYQTLRHINDHFHGMAIDNITKNNIQEYIIELHNKQLKAETIINYYKICNMVFKYVIANEIMEGRKNPCDGVILPKNDKNVVNPFSEKEMEIVLQVQCRPWLYAGELIAYRTGMRKGEIFALQKKDINFNAGFINVQRTQSVNKAGKVILKEPKTKSSRRRISGDKVLMKFLWELVQKTTSEFLFPNGDTFFVPWNISTTFSGICEKAGVPRRTFHDLRHTHASVLFAHNVHPKVVQERLGHASIKTTLDTYSHLIPGMQDAAVNVFNGIA